MHVLISGAGIAGPTLAWFLAKTGARITILEKSKALFSPGQNVDIQGGAVTTIQKMGFLDEVRRHNTKETGTQFIAPNGKPFAPLPISEASSASMTSEFEILHGDLAAIWRRFSTDPQGPPECRIHVRHHDQDSGLMTIRASKSS